MRRAAAAALLVALAAACSQDRSTDAAPRPPGSEVSASEGAALPSTDAATGQAAPTGGATPAQVAPASPAASASAVASETVSPTAVAQAWERRADAPLDLTEVAVAAFDGRLWVAGGLTLQGLASDAVLVYDPGSDTWSQGPALPEGVHHSTLVAGGDALHLVGGYAGPTFDEPTAAVRRLEADATAWVDDVPLPEARGAASGAWDGERIVYGGGVALGPRIPAEVLALGPDGWSVIGPLGSPREHLASASDGEGTTWFLGGRAGGFETNSGAVDVVTDEGVAPLAGEPLTPRGGVAAFVADGLGACLVGGEGPEGTFAEVECVDAAGEVTALPSLQVSRHGLGAAVIDGVAYAALGGEEPGLFTSTALEALPLSEVASRR